jgi:copper chaperone CopZ
MNLQTSNHETGEALMLSISGMTCGGCANTLTRVLSRVPGVTRAEVDLASGRAQVLGTARPDEVLAAVRRAGYGAEITPDTRISGDANEHTRRSCC